MSNASRDENFVPNALGVSSASSSTTLPFKIDSVTGRLLVDLAGGGSVDTISIASANGFAGTSDDNPSTPILTISTTITGFLQGNGTAISAASTTGSGSVLALQTSPSFVTPDINDATVDSLQAGTTSSGIVLKNNAGTTVASFGVGSSSSTNISLSGTVDLGSNNITMTGSLAATGARVTKGWFTDIESTNMITVGGTSLSSTFAALAGSTSQVFSVSSLELNNTDTTISRSSAGVIAVEGVVIPSISSTNTLTNKRITRRLTTTNAPGATPTTNTDNVDIMNFTGLNAAITSMTTNLSGTPSDGDKIEFRFTDNGTARAITWGSSFQATTVALPTTTVISTMLRVGFEWNATASKWDCIATC